MVSRTRYAAVDETPAVLAAILAVPIPGALNSGGRSVADVVFDDRVALCSGCVFSGNRKEGLAGMQESLSAACPGLQFRWRELRCATSHAVGTGMKHPCTSLTIRDTLQVNPGTAIVPEKN